MAVEAVLPTDSVIDREFLRGWLCAIWWGAQEVCVGRITSAPWMLLVFVLLTITVNKGSLKAIHFLMNLFSVCICATQIMLDAFSKMSGNKGMCVQHVKRMSVSLALCWLNEGFVIVDCFYLLNSTFKVSFTLLFSTDLQCPVL